MTAEEKSNDFQKAPELENPSGFINRKKITLGELTGKKVVLVDFWTYSCINCQRTVPYLVNWYEKYKDAGLEIIGIHAPEFSFEKKMENVKWAVEKFGIKYPVVLDNDHGTWAAFQNTYWPRKYLIDIDGYIVYDHIGEGGYRETEEKIQELLKERAERLNEKSEIPSDFLPTSLEDDKDEELEKSPEIYFGSARNLYLGNGESGIKGMQTLPEPDGIKTNILYLTGEWNFEDEFAENKSAGAKIIFRYRAQNVYCVARTESGASLTISIDGKEEETLKIKDDRLYTLVRDDAPGEHTLEILIKEPGLQIFTFTFG